MKYDYPVDAILQFDNNRVTDHNRSELSVTPEYIMNERRMVDATLRRYVVATKRKWSVAWTMLFSKDDATVDGFWSGESIKSFYENTPGEFQLTITTGDGAVERVLVMFESFSYKVVKRTPGATGDWWDMDITLVEV